MREWSYKHLQELYLYGNNIWTMERECQFSPFGMTYRQWEPLPENALAIPLKKPLALLERIIQASSNPGDIVLDPFAVVAQQSQQPRGLNVDGLA